MVLYGEELTLADLGQISDKARASWDYFRFNRKAEPGTLCADVGWHAIATGDDAIIAVDESRDLNDASVFPDMTSFIEWLEQAGDMRQEA